MNAMFVVKHSRILQWREAYAAAELVFGVILYGVSLSRSLLCWLYNVVSLYIFL
jgi:hypothetical protein